MSMSLEQKEPLNEQERLNRFWVFQNRELERRIQRHELVDCALRTLADEEKRQVPFGFVKSLNSALAIAEENSGSLLPHHRKVIAREKGAAGGRARRPDPLNELIGSILRKRPTMTGSELLAKLKALAPGPVVEEVGPENITYTDRSGRLKELPVSGLKDRLSRVRKQLAKKAR